MPSAIGQAVAWWVAENFAISVATFTAIQTGVTLVAAASLSYVAGRAMRPDIPSIDVENRGLRTTIRSPISAKTVVYGEMLVGGTLFFIDTTGDENQHLYMGIIVAGHQVAHIGDVYIDDYLSTNARFGSKSAAIDEINFGGASVPTHFYIGIDGVDYDAATLADLVAALPTDKFTATYSESTNIFFVYIGRLVLTGKTADAVWEVNYAEFDEVISGETLPAEVTNERNSTYLRIEKHTGSPLQLASTLLKSAFPDKWTDYHRLQGLAYIVLRFTFNHDIYYNGIPQMKCVVRGKQPLNSSGLHRWTDNWALCIKDYLQADFGVRALDDEIEDNYMTAAISTSNEQIEIPGPGDYFSGWGIDDFEWGAASDWLVNSGDIQVINDTNLEFTANNTDPYIYTQSGVVKSFYGGLYNIVKIRLKYVSGSLGTWQGDLFWKTSGHGFDGSYYAHIDEPANITDGEWHTLEWDVGVDYFSLNARGDWFGSFITAIRLDLATGTNTKWEIDWITVSRIHRRYTCNGAFKLDQRPVDILDKMLTAAGGALTYVQGKYRLFAGEYITPTITLDESDLAGPMVIEPEFGTDQLINHIKGLFVDKRKLWITTPFPELVNETYEAEDGQRLTREIQLPFTQDPYTSKRLALMHVEKSRQSISVTFPAKPKKALELSAMATVLINNTDAGFVAKPFKVLSWTIDDDSTVLLHLQEESAATYNETPEYVDPAPNTTLPSEEDLSDVGTVVVDTSETQLYKTADGTVITRALVSWDVTDARHIEYEVYYKKSADTDYIPAGTTHDAFMFIPHLVDGVDYDYAVRGMSVLRLFGPYSYALNQTVIGKSAPPSDVTGFAYAFTKNAVRLTWNEIADIDRWRYEIKKGGTEWNDAEHVAYVTDPYHEISYPSAGTVVYKVKAIDTTEHESENYASVSVTVQAPSNPVIQITYDETDITLSWQDCETTFPINHYVVTQDTVVIAEIKSTSITLPVSWASETFYVKAVDVVGNESSNVQSDASVTLPQTTSINSQVIDNQVLLTWSVTPGSLPSGKVEVRRGDVYATADIVGVKEGTFTVIPETLKGVYTYWVTPIDSAGNYGIGLSLAVTVNQPPDYILRQKWTSTWTGTKVNCAVINYPDGDRLLLPVDATETWAEHFTTNSWSTPQDQINAGYPLYPQPNTTTASYTETFDYGTIVPSTIITVDITKEALSGTVACVTTISTSPDNSVWTDYVDTNQILSGSFRYVKITLNFTASGATDLLLLQELSIRLDIKLKSDQGAGTTVIGGAKSLSNLLDYSTWVHNQEGATGFNVYGDSGENLVLSSSDTPGGNTDLVWNGYSNDTDSDADGGWTSSAQNIDTSKKYLFACFVKNTSTNGGNYFGTSPSPADSLAVITSGKQSGTDYRFLNGVDPADGVWRLLVGIVHENGHSGGDLGISGVYSLAGTKMMDGVEFIFNSNCVSLTHNMWKFGVTAVEQPTIKLYRPVIKEVLSQSDAEDTIDKILMEAQDYGLFVPFNEDFLDVSSISITPKSVVPVIPVYDFDDIPVPEGFNVFLFNTSGVTVPADFSWNARGS